MITSDTPSNSSILSFREKLALFGADADLGRWNEERLRDPYLDPHVVSAADVRVSRGNITDFLRVADDIEKAYQRFSHRLTVIPHEIDVGLRRTWEGQERRCAALRECTRHVIERILIELDRLSSLPKAAHARVEALLDLATACGMSGFYQTAQRCRFEARDIALSLLRGENLWKNVQAAIDEFEGSDIV